MNVQLVPTAGGQVIEIGADLTLVGRSHRCDVRLSFDSVSKVHCVVSLVGDRIMIRNLSRRHGCWLNGLLVEKAILKHDDLVGIATVEYRVVVEGMGKVTQPSSRRFLTDSLSSSIVSLENDDFIVEGWKPGLEVFADCTLVARIAAGGFGEVWRAHRKNFGDIALKRIPLADPVRNERRALNVMRGLRHRHLVAVYGCRRRDGVLVVAMEFGEQTLDGCFRAYRSRGQPGIPQRELLRYMRHAALGLDYLYYARNMLHRDIKPANILLVAGVAKLCDFGLAKVLESEMAQHSGVGSFDFAPPEFFESKMIASSDQFSLAATYQYVLCGQLPFPGTGARQVMLQHALGRLVLDGVPPNQHAVLRRALARNPADRFPSCSQFVAALRRAVKGRSID